MTRQKEHAGRFVLAEEIRRDPDDKLRERITILPLSIGFNNEETLVWSGFRIYLLEGRVPSKQEAGGLDSEWWDDITLHAATIYQHVKDVKEDTINKRMLGG